MKLTNKDNNKQQRLGGTYMKPEIIIMLTNNDITVKNAEEY